MRISLLLAAIVATTAFGNNFVNAQGQSGSRPTAPKGTNVAVIDVGFIFKNAERFKRAMDDLKAGDEQFQKQIAGRREAIKGQIQKLQSMPRTSADYQILEEQIAGDQTKLKLDVARKQKDRIEKEAKIYFNAYNEIEYHLKRFCSRYGIDLVVRFNSQEMDPSKPESVLNGINRFVVFQKDLNITNRILDEMNRNTPPPRSNNRVGRPQFQRPGGATKR